MEALLSKGVRHGNIFQENAITLKFMVIVEQSQQYTTENIPTPTTKYLNNSAQIWCAAYPGLQSKRCFRTDKIITLKASAFQRLGSFEL